MSDEDVKITSQKALLEELRKEDDSRDGKRNGVSERVSSGYAESRVGSNDESTRVSDATSSGDGIGQGRTGKRTQDAREFDRTPETVQRRNGSTNRQGIHAVKDIGDDTGRTEKVKFQLKNPFNFKEASKEPVKLFTDKEVKLEHDRLVDVYFRGSSLLDDMLEIVVKDHEPVEIWQLDETEAEMLAELHLSRAQVNEQSARSARQLLAIYDRLYMYLLIGPRMVQTSKHIQEHKGLSFK
jgi:hypothetical protein